MYKLEKVDRDSFESLSRYQRIVEYERADEFWLLEVGLSKYGFALNSNIMIFPVVKYFEVDNVLFMGIHDRVLFFSCNTGQLQFMVGLLDSFTSVERVNLYFLIITETTLMRINQHIFSVDGVHILPDIINKYIIYDNRIVITGLTGEIFELKLNEI